MSKGQYKAVRQRGDRRPNPPLDPQKVRIIDGNSKLDDCWCTMSLDIDLIIFFFQMQ